MLAFILSVVMSLAPVGIDFSALPVQEPERGGFALWLVVHAANGDTYEYGTWYKYAVSDREGYVEEVADKLRRGKCKVRRDGDVLVVESLKGAPVIKVEVRVKEAVGAAPALTWALRPPSAPKAVAPPPRLVVKP